MRVGIKRLESRIAEVEAFEPAAYDGDSSSLTQLRASISDALSRTFGEGTVENNRYREAANFTHPINLYSATPLHVKKEALARCKKISLALLKEAVRSLEERLEELPIAASVPPPEVAKAPQTSNRIFIVHGHDNEAKQTVARFISQLGLQEVILHEQANRNQTIIEKLEANSDVGFAVVLLTPDDEGRAKGEADLKERARQNVVAELGYFVGHLKRHRVCALRKGKVEIPSDFSGVAYVDFEPVSNHWKVELARELKAAGYDLKMDALFG